MQAKLQAMWSHAPFLSIEGSSGTGSKHSAHSSCGFGWVANVRILCFLDLAVTLAGSAATAAPSPVRSRLLGPPEPWAQSSPSAWACLRCSFSCLWTVTRSLVWCSVSVTPRTAARLPWYSAPMRVAPSTPFRVAVPTLSKQLWPSSRQMDLCRI